MHCAKDFLKEICNIINTKGKKTNKFQLNGIREVLDFILKNAMKHVNKHLKWWCITLGKVWLKDCKIDSPWRIEQTVFILVWDKRSNSLVSDKKGQIKWSFPFSRPNWSIVQNPFCSTATNQEHSMRLRIDIDYASAHSFSLKNTAHWTVEIEIVLIETAASKKNREEARLNSNQISAADPGGKKRRHDLTREVTVSKCRWRNRQPSGPVFLDKMHNMSIDN